MNKKDYFILFILGLSVYFSVSLFVHSPGYMDSEYVWSIGSQIFHDSGWMDPFAWNFLDGSYQIPHPAFAYWMPLPSVVAAAGMAFLGEASFRASQLGFILLAACLAPLTAFVSWRINETRKISWLSGLLALFPGYFWIYFVIPENMLLVVVLGMLFILIAFEKVPLRLNWLKPISLGAIAGLMHMSRADGLTWFAAGLVLLGLSSIEKPRGRIQNALVYLAGYGAVSGTWYLHNLSYYGVLFAPGGLSTLWLTSYNNLFIFDTSQLTFTNWLSSGVSSIIQIRFDALVMNIKNIVGVQGSILLLPFIIFGVWLKREDPRVKTTICMWGLILCIMSFVFPFAGSRGGFLHSASALQGIFWSVAPLGFQKTVEAASHVRKWNPEKAWRMFSIALIGICAVLSAVQFYLQVQNGNWENHDRLYQSYEKFLIANGAEPTDMVMIANPPGYYYVTGRGGVVTPDGNQDDIFTASAQYGVDFLIIEVAHVDNLNLFYESPHNLPEADYMGVVNGARIFRLRVDGRP